MRRLRRSGMTQVWVDAVPEAVWAVLSDVTRLGEWSHEARAGRWLTGVRSDGPPGDATRPDETAGSAASAGLVPGARFRAVNEAGRMRWSRTNEILAAEAPRLLSWRTLPTWRLPDSTVWTVRLAPTDGGTTIVQTFEIVRLSPVLERLFALLIPAHRDRGAALAEDLVRLGRIAARSTVTPAGQR